MNISQKVKFDSLSEIQFKFAFRFSAIWGRLLGDSLIFELLRTWSAADCHVNNSKIKLPLRSCSS